jgi:hypothetical protein
MPTVSSAHDQTEVRCGAAFQHVKHGRLWCRQARSAYAGRGTNLHTYVDGSAIAFVVEQLGLFSVSFATLRLHK